MATQAPERRGLAIDQRNLGPNFGTTSSPADVGTETKSRKGLAGRPNAPHNGGASVPLANP
jgi:hypothetical protein